MLSPLAHPDQRLVHAALAGEVRAQRRLVERLTPTIQRAVYGVMRRRGRSSRAEMLDLTQDAFRALFERGGHVLRSWDPGRGATLEGLVGLIAERRASARLSYGRHSAWAEDLCDFDTIELPDGSADAELRVGSKELLERVLDELRVRLSDRGWLMFWSLFVEEHDVERVMREHELSRDAVYAWRSRLQKAIAIVRREVE